MEYRRGFTLRHVTLERHPQRGYGFCIRQKTEKPPKTPRQAQKLENVATYFVGDIIAGASAEKADMSTGDRIISINGTAVTGMHNADVIQIVKPSVTLELLLIPGGEHILGTSASQRPPVRRNLERRQFSYSQQRLHSIHEHAELASYKRKPLCRSMIFSSSQLTTDGSYRTMEENGLSNSADGLDLNTVEPTRRDSTASTGSTTSHTKPAAVKCISYDNIQKGLKLSLPQHSSANAEQTEDSNGATISQDITVQNIAGRQALSTGCLLSSNTTTSPEYTTSAKLTDHFPQKTLTPSSSGSVRIRPSLSVPSTPTPTAEEPRAPVASLDDSDSPSLDRKSSLDSAEAETPRSQSSSNSQSQSQSAEEDSQNGELTGNAKSAAKIIFKPAYRGKSVQEMIRDSSPRAMWQHSNNRSVHRSQSTRNPNNSVAYQHGYYPNNSSSHPQQPTNRINNTPPPTYQNRHYAVPINRNRPSTMNVRSLNDGTHPRMPMKAMQPPTYHGMPVQVTQQPPRYGPGVNYESRIYGTIKQHQHPHQQQHKAQSHSDIQRGGSVRSRVYSDNSTPPSSENDIRGANSENDVCLRNRTAPRQPGRSSLNSNHSIPSGQYHASSSMTSLPQYAQLMTPVAPVPHRSDSTGNIRQRPNGLPIQADPADTRHSYSASPYGGRPQHLSVSSHPQNPTRTSSEDVFDSRPYPRGNTTPTSPVSRQPSYLNAMNASVIRKHNIRKADNGDRHDGKVELRTKHTQQPDEDPHQKILRRTSYLMATSKPESNEDNSKTPNQKYSKLKRFFGEGTPVIKEALQPSAGPEQFTLPDNLEVEKTGILAVKFVSVEGKKANSRSWKVMGAALSRDMLYLVKDKKENANMLTTTSGSLCIDEKPINIRNCFIDYAHAYTKRRHVLKLITTSASEYLFQAEDDKDREQWVKAIQVNRNPDKESEQLTSAQLVKRINDQQAKLNKMKPKTLGGLSFRSKQPNSSPASVKTDSGQKDKRKRNSTGNFSKKFPEYNPDPASGDFGMSLHECAPSHENEYVPLVVELCTKAIEERGLDFVGIYRVPGNKAAVELLKKELNQGIINLDNDKWRDMNVLSSLLKTFFRKLPDSLITAAKYQHFIDTNRLTDPRARLIALKEHIKSLPDYNYETLKYLAIHLRKVAEHGDCNKMDTRNLAIVFGPTLVRSGDDLASLVKDMSDQCRIIESLIVYCEWMFSPNNTEPPAISEAEVNSSCAPISETMNNMSADIVDIASNKKQSNSQLMSALANAATKNISKGSLSATAMLSPQTTQPTRQSPEDDGGFRNRDLAHETAARNQKLQEIKERESRESLNWRLSQHSIQQQQANTPHRTEEVEEVLPQERYLHPSLHEHTTAAMPRWHSEESVLSPTERPHHRVTHDQYPYRAEYRAHHVREQSSESTPPPIPARGEDAKPPLPPKPMQLHHAKPTQIVISDADEGLQSPTNMYENYETLQLKVPPQIPHHRTLHVINHPLKSGSLPRRGSLDSMMDHLEPFPQYSSASSSTESQDGCDLLSSITATFDQKLKLLVDPKYRLDGQGNRRPKTGSDSSSVGGSSVLSRGGHPDSPSSSHPYRNSSDQSRESLLSILSNKENMNACESFSSNQDIASSDRGFNGSNSSVGSAHHRPEAKVGIASRIERRDMKPSGYPSAANAAHDSNTRVVNATGNLVSHSKHPSTPAATTPGSSEDDKDLANNNSLSMDYDDMPMIQRRMSDEKKRIRRRHTVGGARDFELFKDVLSDYKAKQNILNEANAALEQQQPETLTAWQRLQPRDNREPLSLKDWIERERFRASSPELEMHTTPNILHLQRVGRKLAGSLLESNT